MEACYRLLVYPYVPI